MALFTDGPLNGAIDLQSYENRILDVANTEGIDLAGKISLAQDDIASEVMMFLLRRSSTVESPWMPQVRVRQQIGVSDVVVTAPLRQWHAHKALALVYRDAYNNQLNDRYQAKWNEYEQLAKTSSQSYFQIGVGLVAGPISKASPPVLNTIAGNGLAGPYYVAVAWVGDGGQEGEPSDVAEITISTGQQLQVAIVNPPAAAKGWSVYIGQTPTSLGRQNDTPISRGSNWLMTGPLIPGAPAADGQQPSWYLVDHRNIERG